MMGVVNIFILVIAEPSNDTDNCNPARAPIKSATLDINAIQ